MYKKKAIMRQNCDTITNAYFKVMMFIMYSRSSRKYMFVSRNDFMKGFE